MLLWKLSTVLAIMFFNSLIFNTAAYCVLTKVQTFLWRKVEFQTRNNIAAVWGTNILTVFTKRNKGAKTKSNCQIKNQLNLVRELVSVGKKCFKCNKQLKVLNRLNCLSHTGISEVRFDFHYILARVFQGDDTEVHGVNIIMLVYLTWYILPNEGIFIGLRNTHIMVKVN